jgi:nucleotide-binding universal stress UspA family protein
MVRSVCTEILEEARQFALQRHPELKVTVDLTDGTPAHALRDRASGSSMVVVGSRHLSTAQDVFTGGAVALPLVAHAPCPVVVVRWPEHGAHEPPHLVVGVDGSALSAPAVQFAFEEAAFHNARLITVSAWQPSAAAKGREIETEEEWRRLLAEATAGWQEKYPQVEVRHELVAGHPVQVLTEAATWALALVVGSRGRGGFFGLVLGSVSLGVMHHTRCPVIIVPHSAEVG